MSNPRFGNSSFGGSGFGAGAAADPFFAGVRTALAARTVVPNAVADLAFDGPGASALAAVVPNAVADANICPHARACTWHLNQETGRGRPCRYSLHPDWSHEAALAANLLIPCRDGNDCTHISCRFGHQCPTCDRVDIRFAHPCRSCVGRDCWLEQCVYCPPQPVPGTGRK